MAAHDAEGEAMDHQQQLGSDGEEEHGLAPFLNTSSDEEQDGGEPAPRHGRPRGARGDQHAPGEALAAAMQAARRLAQQYMHERQYVQGRQDVQGWQDGEAWQDRQDRQGDQVDLPPVMSSDDEDEEHGQPAAASAVRRQQHGAARHAVRDAAHLGMQARPGWQAEQGPAGPGPDHGPEEQGQGRHAEVPGPGVADVEPGFAPLVVMHRNRLLDMAEGMGPDDGALAWSDEGEDEELPGGEQGDEMLGREGEGEGDDLRAVAARHAVYARLLREAQEQAERQWRPALNVPRPAAGVALAERPLAQPQRRERRPSRRHYDGGNGAEGGGAGAGLGAEEVAEVFTDEEDSDEANDTTAEQLRHGKDIQGIPWERLQFTRENYRIMRLRSFRNYTNVLPDDPAEYRPAMLAAVRPKSPSRDGQFFDFVRNSRAVQSTIVHFQLRNLVWSTSRNDVFVVHDNCVNHWNSATRRMSPVLDLSGGSQSRRLPGVGTVQISTMCIKDGLLAVGGFHGELVVLRLDAVLTSAYSGRVTRSDNGITNGIELCAMRGGGRGVLASNNDCMLRLYSAETFQQVSQAQFPWAVNYSVMDPLGRLAAVVGDNEVAQLVDLSSGSGRPVAELKAHKDFSFAAAWHPGGMLLATGNQDTTAAVWDLRKLSQPVARLAGHMGAIRSLRFSGDGKYLALSEPADFVHIYDVKAGFTQVQEVDLFGELSGISFSPDSEAFFVGVADLTYSSLLEFDRHHEGQRARLGKRGRDEAGPVSG